MFELWIQDCEGGQACKGRFDSREEADSAASDLWAGGCEILSVWVEDAR